MRGGTSKALMLHFRDLPVERGEWAPVLLAAMGSPDPYGRQLDGMGGGLSSLSKVAVIAPSTRRDADVEYTFAQILIKEPRVDYSSICGNILAAVGPFALDEGLVEVRGDQAMVRIYNTNTGKLFHATFPVGEGRARYDGELVIPGVAGSGAPIRLDFLDPGGASTGSLLPTGSLRDYINIPGLGPIEVSMVDAGNACVFVKAHDIGLAGTELPDELERDLGMLERLDRIRVQASMAMGIAHDEASARNSSVPFIVCISGPADSRSLEGTNLLSEQVDLTVRTISNGQPHRALPLTVAVCTAVAGRIEGSVVHEFIPAKLSASESMRLGMPSGMLTVSADAAWTETGWAALHGSIFRTARRLFEGRVVLPHSYSTE